MEILLVALAVLQSIGISLGVGASTMTVVFFFAAIKDGIISPEERNYLGLAYIILRVGMGIILLTSLLLCVIGYLLHGAEYFTAYTAAQAILTTVLFVNAFLMTIHVMPSTFGPAIQASSWYTLGFLMALYGQGITNINLYIFMFAYATVIFFAISFINSMMAYLKEKRKEKTS
jgi:hypothetical protein